MISYLKCAKDAFKSKFNWFLMISIFIFLLLVGLPWNSLLLFIVCASIMSFLIEITFTKINKVKRDN